MARSDRQALAARSRLLPEGRVTGPMPWIIAVMMFLTVLAAAAGLALGAGVRALGSDLAGRATVQIIEADGSARARLSQRVVAFLRGNADVRNARLVEPRRLQEQLRPWLGEEAVAGDLPVPALVDIELAAGDTDARLDRLRRLLGGISTKARIEPHAAFLQPLARLLGALSWLAIGLVALMAIATAAVVILAARAAHDSHKGTIDILHLMGATDVQIARLFQRRIALDAALGGALGLMFALLALVVIGSRLVATDSDLLAGMRLSWTSWPWTSWAVLLALPVGGMLLATITARATVIRALGRSL